MLEINYKKGLVNDFDLYCINALGLMMKKHKVKKITKLSELEEFITGREKDIYKDIMKERAFNSSETAKYLTKMQANSEEDIINAILQDKKQNSKSFSNPTPKSLATLMIEILNIKDDKNIKVVDLYSGEGVFEEILYNKLNKINIEGYELNSNSILIAKIKMYAMGKEANYYKKNLLEEDITENKYDYAIADVPFLNVYDRDIEKYFSSAYKNLDINISGKVSSTWLSGIRMINSLKENGRGIITTLKGSLFNVLDRDIRKSLIDKGYIEAVIEIPSKILPYTNVDICLIVFNKSNMNKGIKFVDLQDCGITSGRGNVIDKNKAMKKYKETKESITYESIKDKEYSLNSNLYSNNIEIVDGVKLSDITSTIFRGYQITSSEVNKMFVDDARKMNYKILEIGNINDDGEIVSELKMIDSKGKNLDKYLLEDGDIVISARGDKIKKALIHLKKDEKIIANGSINVIRVNKEKADPLYLKMFLDSEKGTVTINNIKSGVTIPSLNVGELQKIIVPCPNLEKQHFLCDKYEIKLEMIKSTKKRLEELKNEMQNIANQI